MALGPDPATSWRRRPRTVGGVAYLAMAAATAVGLALAVVGAWRTGVGWMGAALIGGAVARLVLPETAAGMLRVRRKAVDVVTMGLLGGALLVLAAIIPAPPA